MRKGALCMAMHILAALLAPLCGLTIGVAAQFNTGNTGYSADQAGLLAMMNAFTNWKWYQSRAECNDWSDRPGAMYCNWDGVACNSAGQVVEVKFLKNGSYLTGSVGDLLYGASLMPNLKVLDASDQALAGQLPSVVLPLLEELNLANNSIQGAIPEDWGASGSLPNLQKLALSFNFELSGQLPTQWGSDGSSLQNLTSVEITNCDLSGPLPPSWAGNLPSLTKLNVSANALSGTLPALWSTLSLTTLAIDRNSLTGMIPASWGASGALSQLSTLQMAGNLLNGTIPEMLQNSSSPNAFAGLKIMDVGNNQIQGSIPQRVGAAGMDLLTGPGNAICGAIPGGMSVYSCFYNNCTCGAVTHAFSSPDDTCNGQLQPYSLRTNSTPATAEGITLMRAAQALDNFDLVSRTRAFQGWDSFPVCTWTGISCSAQQSVIGVNFTMPYPPAQPAQANMGHDIMLAGSAAAVLTALSGLPSLTYIDFSRQNLYGALPNNVVFPKLKYLNLRHNALQGALPSRSTGAEMPLLQFLLLDANWNLTGPLPADWGQNGSMDHLSVLSAHDCNLRGTLPPSWPAQLPNLQVIDLPNNLISGALPDSWSSFGSVTILSLKSNNLTGTLPNAWGQGGRNTLPVLQTLDLTGNSLTGTLPSTWGKDSAMSSLTSLGLAKNNFSGTIPAEWGTGANNQPRFSQLANVTLLPGNGYLCSSVPPGLPAYGRYYYTDTWVKLNCTCCDGDAPAPAPAAAAAAVAAQNAPSAQAGGHSANGHLGAIIGGVVGPVAVVALLLSIAAWIMLRRHQRGHKDDPEASYKTYSTPGSAMEDVKPHGKMDDSSEFIKGINAKDPRADMMMDSDSFIAANPRSLLELDRPPKSIPISETESTRSATSLGSLPGSLRSTESDPSTWTLPTLPWRDWELNLDDLRVFLNDDGTEMELGRGGFGVVLRGTYRMAPVAIKRLKDQSLEQQEVFMREMALLRGCRGSRYIVPFVGASLQLGCTVLAMDLMENGSLWMGLTRKGKDGKPLFQWNQRGKRVAYEVLMGLHYLHGFKVVMLDLKSPNVLLAADGTAKLADVGLARLMSVTSLSHRMPTGTWAWAAPEALLGNRVTVKADIYSFGVLLWEIITLERPLQRGNLRVPSVPDEAPQDIVDLMERCMQMDPEARPDAAECIAVVSNHLRLQHNGSGKFRDAPMRTSSSGDSAAPMGRRRSSLSSGGDFKATGPPRSLSGRGSSGVLMIEGTSPPRNSPPRGASNLQDSAGEGKPPLWQLT